MPEMKHWREDPEEELARLIQTNELTDFWTSNIHTVVEPGESAVIIKDGNIETLPIKGTRPTSEDKIRDDELANELVNSEKDRAENIMIVDLLRNDLSKVCEIGSIIVPEILKLESFLKVHHLTSVIKGRLKKAKNWIDFLKACWPGGSVTGGL